MDESYQLSATCREKPAISPRSHQVSFPQVAAEASPIVSLLTSAVYQRDGHIDFYRNAETTDTL